LALKHAPPVAPLPPIVPPIAATPTEPAPTGPIAASGPALPIEPHVQENPPSKQVLPPKVAHPHPKNGRSKAFNPDAPVNPWANP
jgi:hypothetical protein